MPRLTRSFYARPARQVAARLLGKKLVRIWEGERISGLIVETEAYCDGDEPDLACHGDRANNGRPTDRTRVMFGPAGYAYVYFTYGIHWMFNIVSGQKGEANAVLIRALQPIEGQESMRFFRNRPDHELTNGPAKLTQALAIDKSLNGVDLCDGYGPVWVEEGVEVAASQLATGPRIGLGRTPEPWFSIPWRYWIQGNSYVSR
ncbi:MAG: DNA-3-methyladenine glycosylase [Candidatus Promineifilaceae bacterium]|nr:DNA-3-methyladenine glycosylase [Candidatus Promineifilaceae bacterium]